MSNPLDPNLGQQSVYHPQSHAQDQAQPAPGQPIYMQPVVVQPVMAPVGTNTAAIISMISSLVGWFSFGVLCLVGVILGHVSLKQIKRTGETGRGMAVTGLVVGYIGIAGWILVMIGLVIMLGIAGTAIATSAASSAT